MITYPFARFHSSWLVRRMRSPVRKALVAAITTTNVATLKLKIGTQTFGLAETNPGQWLARFPFPASAVSPGQTGVALSLVAARADGTSATISIPVSLGGQ
jgi:hypothetical protein